MLTFKKKKYLFTIIVLLAALIQYHSKNISGPLTQFNICEIYLHGFEFKVIDAIFCMHLVVLLYFMIIILDIGFIGM